MRFKLIFKLENETIPIQYRKNVISFLKLSLEEYDIEYFNKFYHKKDRIIKPYTFSVYLRNAKINSETITVPDKTFTLNISIADIEIATILYNSFNHQIRKKIPMDKNSLTLIDIAMIPEKKILEDKIIVKFMSPLVVHDRNRETRKDYFYSFEDEKFLETLKINIKNQLEGTDITLKSVESFNIIPIKAKKTVVKFYEKQIEVSLGSFELSGDKKLLNLLYQGGIGSKRSAGFRNVPNNIIGR